MAQTTQDLTTQSGTSTDPALSAIAPGRLRVIKRDSTVAPYAESKISIAITKAYLAVEGGNATASSRVRTSIADYVSQVTGTFQRRLPSGGTIHIEEIQDQVELILMRKGEHKVARAYVLYREDHARARERQLGQPLDVSTETIKVRLDDGTSVPLDVAHLGALVEEACLGLEGVEVLRILDEARKNMFDGMASKDVDEALVMGARVFCEEEPDYIFVASRLLLGQLRREVLAFLGVQRSDALPGDYSVTQAQMAELYPHCFLAYVARGIELELLAPRLGSYDLERLGRALKPERDAQFTLIGLQTLYDRYFLHSNEVRLELPQCFFMRVAMGLALNEDDPEARAIEFYELLSSFDYMTSTPTLFNAGTRRPQLSSCYLTTVPDNLDGIYNAIHDNAMLSKFAGGLGNDWTPVRALGSYIKGTNGKSKGVVPFLKVANDTALAVNQGGKREGAVCAYLETWHLDIEEFLELRKNTGDDRHRTHDMNTANWVPDLFMKRVIEAGDWTLFSPSDVPDLHDLIGKAFEARYVEYERMADTGELKLFRRVKAAVLWRKMLSMLFETGHPWITFKDSCNLRSPQQHMGVIHSSNLCTEITLNTSAGAEIAVCNLGSVNFAQHVSSDGIDFAKLEKTVTTAVRMLDNVIDVNFYSVSTAEHSNLKHRPVALGLMGFQDALYKQRIPYGSDEAVEFADRSMEAISYYAIHASSQLAVERGRYGSFPGSLWSRGILPIDSINILREERGADYLRVDDSQTFDWGELRKIVKTNGMRNSNVMAIAPTATIANIVGVSPSIEPTYSNLYTKSNKSGDFITVNASLVRDLKERGLWDGVMLNDLKYYQGSLDKIDRVPQALKALYVTAFELEPRWLVEAASRRQKWLDQAQSLNLYIRETSGKKLDLTYKMAWLLGLKTTYYLRALGASHVEQSTVDRGSLNAVTNVAEGEGGSESSEVVQPTVMPVACSIQDPDCEACQ